MSECISNCGRMASTAGLCGQCAAAMKSKLFARRMAELERAQTVAFMRRLADMHYAQRNRARVDHIADHNDSCMGALSRAADAIERGEHQAICGLPLVLDPKVPPSQAHIHHSDGRVEEIPFIEEGG